MKTRRISNFNFNCQFVVHSFQQMTLLLDEKRSFISVDERRKMVEIENYEN